MNRWSTPRQYLNNEGSRQEKNRREIPYHDVFVDSRKARMTSPVWERKGQEMRLVGQGSDPEDFVCWNKAFGFYPQCEGNHRMVLGPQSDIS